MTSLLPLHDIILHFTFHSRFHLPVPKSTHAHGFIMLPPRQPRVFARLARWQSLTAYRVSQLLRQLALLYISLTAYRVAGYAEVGSSGRVFCSYSPISIMKIVLDVYQIKLPSYSMKSPARFLLKPHTACEDACDSPS